MDLIYAAVRKMVQSKILHECGKFMRFVNVDVVGCIRKPAYDSIWDTFLCYGNLLPLARGPLEAIIGGTDQNRFVYLREQAEHILIV